MSESSLRVQPKTNSLIYFWRDAAGPTKEMIVWVLEK